MVAPTSKSLPFFDNFHEPVCHTPLFTPKHPKSLEIVCRRRREHFKTIESLIQSWWAGSTCTWTVPNLQSATSILIAHTL